MPPELIECLEYRNICSLWHKTNVKAFSSSKFRRLLYKIKTLIQVNLL